MPKMKTHRGAAKRFSKTGSGKIKRNHAFTSHILEKKSPKRKEEMDLEQVGRGWTWKKGRKQDLSS